MLLRQMLPTRDAGKGDDVRATAYAVKNGGSVGSTFVRIACRERCTATHSSCTTAGAAEQADGRCPDPQPRALRSTGPEDDNPCNVPPTRYC
jgi:hypothetical protein